MKFCDGCKNMLYVKIEEKILIYYCKNCKSEDPQPQQSILVIDDNKINNETKCKQYMNKYLSFDPTLPRVNNIICTNTECTKTDKEDNEVIYIKYDPVNMYYLYHCCHCKHFWKTI